MADDMTMRLSVDVPPEGLSIQVIPNGRKADDGTGRAGKGRRRLRIDGGSGVPVAARGARKRGARERVGGTPDETTLPRKDAPLGMTKEELKRVKAINREFAHQLEK